MSKLGGALLVDCMVMYAIAVVLVKAAGYKYQNRSYRFIMCDGFDVLATNCDINSKFSRQLFTLTLHDLIKI